VEGLCCAAVEPEVFQFPEANHKVGGQKKGSEWNFMSSQWKFMEIHGTE